MTSKYKSEGNFSHIQKTPDNLWDLSLIRVTLNFNIFRVVDKSRNMEHSGTFRNIPEQRIIMIIMTKICKIKLSKTEKTRNLEVAKLKLHKYYHFMIIL